MDSAYDNPEKVKAAIQRGTHRQLIGGMWDEIGQLQLDFLVAQGVQPTDRLLDIGCGALRGGVKLIPFLAPGNYWGIDNNALLLQVGCDIELARSKLQGRQPREQLVCLKDFEFATLDMTFDIALAQSVFTHFSLNRIRRCLARLAPHLRPGARLFASFFELPEGADNEETLRHGEDGPNSYSDRPFFHYSLADFNFVVRDLPLNVRRIGAWGHPRGQNMLEFTRD